MEGQRHTLRVLEALSQMGAALTAALDSGRGQPGDHGFPGRLGAPLRVWMEEFGPPEPGPAALDWPMDDGLLLATPARQLPAEAAGPAAAREPIIYVERRWHAGREPDLVRAMEVAESLLPGDACPADRSWLPLPEPGRPLAGLHLLNWRSEVDLCGQALRDELGGACPYGGGIMLAVKELAPDVVAAFWLLAARSDDPV